MGFTRYSQMPVFRIRRWRGHISPSIIIGTGWLMLLTGCVQRFDQIWVNIIVWDNLVLSGVVQACRFVRLGFIFQ
jgi:hypothetical protein